jgi:hypothetical protein
MYKSIRMYRLRVPDCQLFIFLKLESKSLLEKVSLANRLHPLDIKHVTKIKFLAQESPLLEYTLITDKIKRR